MQGEQEGAGSGRTTSGAGLEPLEPLFEAGDSVGDAVPLPEALAAFYGTLRLAGGRGGHGERPRVVANFIETLDGVVALGDDEADSGGGISGGSAQDRAVMGLLRAAADAVVVGAATLRAVPRHRWTAEYIFRPFAGAYGELRRALGKAGPPLAVIVSGSGELDVTLPVFSAGEAPVLIVTTAAGAERLRGRGVPAGVRVAAPALKEPRQEGAEVGRVSAAGVLAVVREAVGEGCGLVLVEGGPHLLGDFYAEGLLDEQFLTLAPRVAGRDAGTRRLALVEGAAFPVDGLVTGRLLSVRRGGALLFLRYGFGRG